MKDRRLRKMLLITICCLACVAVLSPAQLPLVVYKVGLVCLGACIFFWIDRVAFPYSRPDGYLVNPWVSQMNDQEFVIGKACFEVADGYQLVFALSFCRRAMMMCIGGALGVALGL